jgi:hypothetical protein
MFNIINLKNMKVLAYKISTLCLLAGSIGLSAQGKVGINTENPAYTLDVNGTVRIADTPNDHKTQWMLGIDENKQVVKLPSVQKLGVFEKKRVYVDLFVNDSPISYTAFGATYNIYPFQYIYTEKNLNIDAKKYIVTLLKASIVQGDGSGSESNPGDTYPVPLKLISVADVNDNTTQVVLPNSTFDKDQKFMAWNNAITNVHMFDNGGQGRPDRFGSEDGEMLLQGSIVSTKGREITDDRTKTPFLSQVLNTYVHKNGNSWEFVGRSDFSAPAKIKNSSKKLYWVLDLLIIKKTWAQELKTQYMDVTVYQDTNKPAKIDCTNNCTYPLLN